MLKSDLFQPIRIQSNLKCWIKDEKCKRINLDIRELKFEKISYLQIFFLKIWGFEICQFAHALEQFIHFVKILRPMLKA